MSGDGAGWIKQEGKYQSQVGSDLTLEFSSLARCCLNRESRALGRGPCNGDAAHSVPGQQEGSEPPDLGTAERLPGLGSLEGRWSWAECSASSPLARSQLLHLVPH